MYKNPIEGAFEEHLVYSHLPAISALKMVQSGPKMSDSSVAGIPKAPLGTNCFSLACLVQEFLSNLVQILFQTILKS